MVVGDDDDDAGVVLKELLEPTDGQDVQMIGGLVQEKCTWVCSQGLSQKNPQLEASREG